MTLPLHYTIRKDIERNAARDIFAIHISQQAILQISFIGLQDTAEILDDIINHVRDQILTAQ